MDKVDLAFSLFLYEMLNKNCSNHSAVTMLTTLATEEKAKPGNDYTQSQPIFNQKWLEKCYTMYYWEIQPNQIWLKQLIPIKRTQMVIQSSTTWPRL